MHKRFAFLILAVMSATQFSACDDETPPPSASTSCPANAAMISVADGYLETLCGCAEPAPAYYASGSRLLCTVTAGTTLIFHYLGTRNRHQIVPTGTPVLPPSPVSIPDQATPIRVHAAKLDDSGTYSFEDAFDSSLTGDIVVL